MLPNRSVTRLADALSNAAPAPDSRSPRCIVLDTNTVLDWLVFGEPPACAVGAAVTQGLLQWLATARMLAELQAVLSRPLIARWEPARELALTIDVAKLASICAEPITSNPRLICRDPADQMFIDLAHAHRPAVLLTRDRALLALRRQAAALGVDVSTAAVWRPPRLGASV